MLTPHTVFVLACIIVGLLAAVITRYKLHVTMQNAHYLVSSEDSFAATVLSLIVGVLVGLVVYAAGSGVA